MTDIDLLSSQFVQMRNEPNMMVTKFRFDNVPFVCNLIDAVGGEIAVPRNPQAQAEAQHAANDRDFGHRGPQDKQKMPMKRSRPNTTRR